MGSHDHGAGTIARDAADHIPVGALDRHIVNPGRTKAPDDERDLPPAASRPRRARPDGDLRPQVAKRPRGVERGAPFSGGEVGAAGLPLSAPHAATQQATATAVAREAMFRVERSAIGYQGNPMARQHMARLSSTDETQVPQRRPRCTCSSRSPDSRWASCSVGTKRQDDHPRQHYVAIAYAELLLDPWDLDPRHLTSPTPAPR